MSRTVDIMERVEAIIGALTDDGDALFNTTGRYWPVPSTISNAKRPAAFVIRGRTLRRADLEFGTRGDASSAKGKETHLIVLLLVTETDTDDIDVKLAELEIEIEAAFDDQMLKTQAGADLAFMEYDGDEPALPSINQLPAASVVMNFRAFWTHKRGEPV